MTGNILVVGQTSFLANKYALAASNRPIRQISWTELEVPGILDGIDTVINFSFNPRLYTESYRPELDVDLWIAERIKSQNIRYILLSSRTVYGVNEKWCATEVTPTSGDGVYGRNRTYIESAILQMLGEARVLILRLSNTIGFELQPGRRRTFMSQVLETLKKKNEIRFDMNPFSQRDFVTDIYLANVLWTLTESGCVGTFNLGCGFPVHTGQIAMWVLDGYGKGSFISDSSQIKDEFYVDASRLYAATGLSISMEDIRNYCIAIGKQLAAV